MAKQSLFSNPHTAQKQKKALRIDKHNNIYKQRDEDLKSFEQ